MADQDTGSPSPKPRQYEPPKHLTPEELERIFDPHAPEGPEVARFTLTHDVWGVPNCCRGC